MTSLLTTLALQVALNITGNCTTGLSPTLGDQGYVRFPNVHAAYKIHEELATWNEARELCMSEGAHLAITDSFEKILAIKSMRNQSDQWLHVGIYNFVGTDRWVRIDDGLPVSSVPWAYGKPNRFGTCAGISMFLDGLVDYQCNGKREYFVCETRITEDNNATESSVADLGLIANLSTLRNYIGTLPDGYVAHPDVGAAYKVIHNIITWKQARKLCFNEGAQLALIDSVKKINYLRGKIPNGHYAFVGIHRFDGEWVSVRDGTVVKSIPWAQGYPSGVANCVELAPDKSGLYNGSCENGHASYVCELPIPTP